MALASHPAAEYNVRMASQTTIDSPDSPLLDALCQELADRAVALDRLAAGGASQPTTAELWPTEQLELCGRYGVYRWFAPVEFGGLGWSDADIIRGYLKLSAACLTTTFILTQRTGACLRILGSENRVAIERWLPGLLSGSQFATVGISHLTTSRRHLTTPVMQAQRCGDEFVLDGYSPWVTGGDRAAVIALGATLSDGDQILVALPTGLVGVSTPTPPQLVGLSASRTGQLVCERVRVGRDCLLAGPAANVMKMGPAAGAGGLQTSTLAIGHASASIAFMEREASLRPELTPAAESLRHEQIELQGVLLRAANGDASCSNETLRAQANSLVLRATQAALAAAKGAGFVVGHPVGRWCREALFFLVWSCPQPVLAANLCQFAQLE